MQGKWRFYYERVSFESILDNEELKKGVGTGGGDTLEYKNVSKLKYFGLWKYPNDNQIIVLVKLLKYVTTRIIDRKIGSTIWLPITHFLITY